jgi:hypothetical protein
MWWLWGIGANVEQLLGPVKLLVIFVLGVWGSSCLGMAITPRYEIGGGVAFPLIGSSGAVCAFLGALAMWVLLVGRHLPSEVSGAVWSQILMSGGLMVLFSLMSNIPSWSLLGGAIAGALASFALHFASYGPRVVRPMAWLAVPAIAFLCYGYMQHRRETSEAWAKIEPTHFIRNVYQRVQDASDAAREANGTLEWMLEKQNPVRRDPDELKAALDSAGKAADELETLAARLKNRWPYRTKDVGELFEQGEEYVEARLRYMRESIRLGEAGEKATRADTKKWADLYETMSKLRVKWDRLGGRKKK